MSENLVANELLAFLQQKLDVMDEVSAIQICVTNFSEDDIAASKLLLFRILNKSDQMTTRRREGTKKSVQDIITLLKETDPDQLPTFVVRDLNKLPPVSFDHVDVTSLLKDIVLLKARLADVERKLEASQQQVTEVRAELVDLRNTVCLSGSPARVNNVNMRRGAGRNNSLCMSFASAVLSSPTPIGESADCADLAPRSSCPAPMASTSDAERITPPTKSLMTASSPAAPAAKREPDKAKNRADLDGFVKVQRKKHRKPTNKNCCGKAPVEPQTRVRAAKPNTPVYISRLHYTTRADDIAEYVRQKLKYEPRVQLLESRRNVNFKAFVVRIPTCYLHLVLDENFWPQDVVFRRFRGQIPPERTIHSARKLLLT